MFIIGILNDEKMANIILDELAEREIKAHYFYSDPEKSFVVAVEDEKYLPIALDIYRVRLGFKKPIEVDAEWIKIKSIPNGQFTINIIIFCVVIYLLSFLPIGTTIYSLFKIDESENGILPLVVDGEVWRIITPIFLHMSLMHILFNMLWFKDLGNLFEFKYGKVSLLIFIIISGGISNLFQYIFTGPHFGGMSGVLYGLLGFLWVKQSIDQDFEYALPKRDIYLMIGWFFLCLFGIFPKIANFAHAGGAFVGICWAVFEQFKFDSKHLKYFGYGVGLILLTIVVEKFGWQLKY
jgi:GlpG protein